MLTETKTKVSLYKEIDLEDIMIMYRKAKCLWGTKFQYGILYKLIQEIPVLVTYIKKLRNESKYVD